MLYFLSISQAAISQESMNENNHNNHDNNSKDSFGKSKSISYWLFGLSGMVFSMVVVGGLTRLTKSGLSMIWNFIYEKAPSTNEEWEKEFEKYKQSPEYIKMNSDITLKNLNLFIIWNGDIVN